MQTFTPIGVTIAKIFWAIQNNTDAADVMYDKTHTSVVFNHSIAPNCCKGRDRYV